MPEQTKNKPQLGPYQEGVQKALKEGGYAHAQEALMSGVPAQHIEEQSGLTQAILDGMGVPQEQPQQQPQQPQGQNVLMNLLKFIYNPQDRSMLGGFIQPSAEQVNLSPEQLANTINAYNEKLPEGYQAAYTAEGKISASKPVSLSYQTPEEDVNNTVSGIVSGQLPPDVNRLTSFRDRTKVTGRLAKEGYDLKTANLDWAAANKFYSSMNSTQQVRLRQAINSVNGALDNLDLLNAEYKRSGFTPVNKAQLIANSKGLGKQAELATQYLAQLKLIQDELSQVFMGGNSPTEKFLQQAQSILKGDYTMKQLEAVSSTVRQNLVYRLNSINQAQAYTPENKNAYEKVTGESPEQGNKDSSTLKRLGLDPNKYEIVR